MAIISTQAHGVLDYAGGLGSLAAPKVIRDRRAAALLALTGAGTLAASAFTDYELGLRRRIPMPVHLLIDAATGALLLTGARALRRRGAGPGAWAPLALVGAAEVMGAALTESRPADRSRSGGTGRASATPAPDSPVAAGPGAGVAGPVAGVAGPVAGVAGPATGVAGPAAGAAAPAPNEAPGPSVNPIGGEASDVERREHVDALLGDSDGEGSPDDDVLVARQEAAAAAEAARIGGRVASETGDAAMDPVYEAGGGDQEGWEASEDELIENATHGDGRAHPEQDAFTPEAEADRSGAVYGEADRIPSTEVLEDPATGSDDPAQGPGLAADRGPGAGADPAQEES